MHFVYLVFGKILFSTMATNAAVAIEARALNRRMGPLNTSVEALNTGVPPLNP